MMKRFLSRIATALAVTMLGGGVAFAGPLMDRIEAGEPIRIGFANEVPWAYPGDSGEPLGFVNAHAIGVLNAMGYDNIEPVVTEWGGLIPGLNAGRFDIITGGMYILKERCENVAFSDPMAQVGDAFLVPEGNPNNISTWEDMVSNDLTLVTGAGYNTVKVAKQEGMDATKIMEVPGPTEILAAVKAGRADAGGMTAFTAVAMANAADGVEVTDPTALPEEYQNWVGIAFHKDDADFVEKFNAAQAEYLGSPAMLESVAEYGFDEKSLPGDTETAWVCENR